ncbi:MAG: hypothetical protein KIT43_14830 [Bauldia sp.]|nr:hypothetical protein [Bauldia sp.]MCW5718187.1 hypothetical protein [Bauldia sp.]
MNRKLARIRNGILAIALGGGALVAASSAFSFDPPVTVWTGVYTDVQADRGMATFTSRGCAGCHGADMNGTPGGPGLVRGGFPLLWYDKSVGEFMDWIVANMPPGNPGSLGPSEYADIVAQILRANGFPASETIELTPENAPGAMITRATP